MHSHIVIGSLLMAVAAIAGIWFMAVYQVPTTLELASELGFSMSAIEVWIANIGVVLAFVLGGNLLSTRK